MKANSRSSLQSVRAGRALAGALAGLVCLAAPSGADVLTVGPAGQFAEIQDAIDAASPDDVILVAPGTYSAIDVAIPLRILGDGSGSVVVTAVGDNGISVTGIELGEEVVVSGIEVQANTILAANRSSIFLHDNPGTVALHDITINFAQSEVGVYAENSGRLLILASEILNAGLSGIFAGAAVTGINSELWITDSTIVGRTGATGFIEPGGHGVKITGGVLRVWRSSIHGGDASRGGTALFVPGAGGHGVSAVNAQVSLFGGPAGELTGGDGVVTPLAGDAEPGGSGLRLQSGSQARIQSLIPITGGFDGPGTVQSPGVAADPGSTFVPDATIFPTLQSGSTQVATGGSVAMTMEGSPSSLAALFLSVKTGPTITPFGAEGYGMLQVATAFQLTVGVLDAAGKLTVNVPVPPAPAVLGTTAFLQFGEVASGKLLISSPAMFVIASSAP